LSNENFQQTIDDFFKDKNVAPLIQFTAKLAFPKPYLLVQFAFKANKDYINETLTLRMRHSFTYLEIDISHFATNFERSAAIGL